MKTIYDLNLHESMVIDFGTVTRVPGGWIYTRSTDNSVFVPFNSEFAFSYGVKNNDSN